MDIVGLGYVGVSSPHYKAWHDYGPEVFGFGLGEVGEDETVYLRMDSRRYRLAIHPGDTNHLEYIGWELKGRGAFEEALAALEKAGIEFAVGDDALRQARHVHEVAQFKDPAGLPHEIFFGQEYHPHSFVPGRAMGGFVGDNLGMGHVVVAVPEYGAELEDFVFNVLGLTWFGYGAIRGGTGFFRAPLNPRSHVLGIVTVPGHRGLHHLGIEANELDDVGIAWDRAQEREASIMFTLGRHIQDPVVSFYSFTPSDFVVEYMNNGIQVADADFVEENPQQLSVWGHKPVDMRFPDTIEPIA